MSESPRYEYKFVRLGESRFRVQRRALSEYRDVIRSQALDGWRLAEVLTPSTGWMGFTSFVELIFERPAQ